LNIVVEISDVDIETKGTKGTEGGRGFSQSSAEMIIKGKVSVQRKKKFSKDFEIKYDFMDVRLKVYA
jgi:hypothetical protein